MTEDLEGERINNSSINRAIFTRGERKKKKTKGVMHIATRKMRGMYMPHA